MIHYAKPSITELEMNYAADAVREGWGSKCYDYIHTFEDLFAQHLGVNYAMATSSCTGALHLGLKALGIGPGDEIILADTNWVATMAPITYLGATPVLVDILPDTWCIDPAKASIAITSKTKAIIATHLYGNLCNMDYLWGLGRKHGIPIIEDAAEAIGSVYHGEHAGSMGTFGVFSFHGTKTISTGEGGMLVTNNSALYEDVLTLNNHGRPRHSARQFWPEQIGFKYKMSNVQAAIGCGQMERIDELVARKKKIFEYYNDAFFEYLPGITMNPEPDGCVNGYWMPTCVFDRNLGITRERLLDMFKAADIDARVFFWPLSSLPFCQPNRKNVNAYDIPERSINLPSYHDMTEIDQDQVIDVIWRAME